ncbi:MAG: hypothetical protein K2Y32_07925 [Candidatus Obscuribacterales bacterium]|nr:hypothetical protein [Candidatus Obscuribacterales bacterium]
MIKLSKPVQLLQWGEGTNTTNQRWIEVGKGRIAGKPRREDGITDVVIVLDGSLNKIDAKRETDFVKIMQQGEGMTPRADRWGEVAMGTLKSVSSSGGQTLVTIAVKAATKVGP